MKRNLEQKLTLCNLSLKIKVSENLNNQLTWKIDENIVTAMNEDDRTLDFYAPQQHYTIHVF